MSDAQEQMDEFRQEAHKLLLLIIEALGIDRLTRWLSRHV